MNIPLSAFPAPLLRLILCGGKRLAPAWGPVLQAGSQVLGCGDPNYGQWAWDAVLGAAVRPDRAPKCLLDKPDGWSLPLDAASPWPARLAMVAAWMCGHLDSTAMRFHAAQIIAIDDRIGLSTMLRPTEGQYGYTRDINAGWSSATGNAGTLSAGPALPSIPNYLQTYPPAVALLLALYDVPKIRARVESA